MQQLLSGDIWDKVNQMTKGSTGKKAAIAYVTSSGLDLKQADVLICNASDFAVKNGQTKAVTLKYYHEKGVAIYSNASLHCKMFLTGKYLVVGSSNLSTNSAKKLTETAVVSDDQVVVSQAQSFFYNLLKESQPLNETEIRRLLNLPVVERSFPRIKKSEVRDLIFGNAYWVLNAQEQNKHAFRSEEGFIEEASTSIVNQYKIGKEEITYIRFSRKIHLEAIDSLKEGDQFIEIFTNRDATRTNVAPFTPVLKVQREEKWTRVYFSECAKSDRMSWSKLYMNLRKEGLTNLIDQNSLGPLTEEGALLIKNVLEN